MNLAFAEAFRHSAMLCAFKTGVIHSLTGAELIVDECSDIDGILDHRDRRLYLLRPRRKTLDVVRQVLRGLIGLALELLEVQLARVVEGVAGDLVQDRLRVLDLALLQSGVAFQHLGFGRLQDAVEATENR